MKLGVYLPVSYPRGLPDPTDVIDYAVEAEQLGFDSLWIGDHLLWRTPMPEPLTTLSFIAARTSQIQIGLNVYLAALRPALISARLLGNLSWLAAGRLVLGVGVGGDFPREFEAVGVPISERGRRLDSTLAEIREWWEQEDAGGVHPGLGGDLPLWIGGRSEAALRRVIRERATAFTAHMVDAQQLTRVRTRLHELASEAGQQPPEIAATVMLHIRADDDAGDDDADAFLLAHFGDGADRVSRFLIRGTADECAERLAAFSEVADHLIGMPVSHHPRRHLARIRQIAPTVESR